ncbi:MAG: 4-(cytidine 5'-diphospho)-2-C-methyl-D-erythritol kinase [Eubacterium sp.]|nr:4-(cytidine 5'-diphospho)-2-C-methyl-D-erythritol kinase [Eubacterium sp.]
MSTVTAQCFAKLNLFLDITGTMPNGYHYLNNITQSVSLSDTVTVSAEKSDKFSCAISCDVPDIPTDERNTAYKAAKAFTEAAGINAEIMVSVTKRIPVMGGMGGSSVDAAAVIYALNHLLGTKYSSDRLCEIGDKVGADVGLCLLGGTVISGKEYRKLETENDCCFVCVQPDFKCSTAEAYSLYDKSPLPANEKFSEFAERLEQGGIQSVYNDIYNIFTLLHNDERIATIKSELIKQGAVNAELTGSGSVVYGIFEDMTKANIACAMLSSKYPRVFVCRPVNDGVLLF